MQLQQIAEETILKLPESKKRKPKFANIVEMESQQQIKESANGQKDMPESPISGSRAGSPFTPMKPRNMKLISN